MKELRVNYTRNQLLEGSFPDNPFDLFVLWFKEAEESSLIKEPNAMTISTVDGNSVDSRIVLLKDLRNEEFVFYTNYESNKGLQLAANPNCTLLFPWIHLERQIIIRGTASKTSEEESLNYFLSRPASSQIGAWASSQSKDIQSRDDLEDKLKFYEEKFDNQDINKPIHWGGYQISPLQIEFWQGRQNRLHDRILFEKKDGLWSYKRLQP